MRVAELYREDPLEQFGAHNISTLALVPFSAVQPSLIVPWKYTQHIKINIRDWQLPNNDTVNGAAPPPSPMKTYMLIL